MTSEEQQTTSQSPQQNQPRIASFALLRLLTLSRVAPLITGLIGYEFFDAAYLGVVIGFGITLLSAGFVSLRAGLDRRWNILVWLPVALWGIGILWYGLTL